MTMDWSRIIDQQAEQSRQRDVEEAARLKAAFPAFEESLWGFADTALLDIWLEWQAPRHSLVITEQRVRYAEACKQEILRRMS